MFKVLVVEDKKAVSEIIVEFLKILGFEADVTPTASKALEFFSHNHYYLAIIDGELPDKYGPWLVREIRKKSPYLPTIGISGSNYKQAFLQAGANAYLAKPFTFEELRKILISIVNYDVETKRAIA